MHCEFAVQREGTASAATYVCGPLLAVGRCTWRTRGMQLAWPPVADMYVTDRSLRDPSILHPASCILSCALWIISQQPQHTPPGDQGGGILKGSRDHHGKVTNESTVRHHEATCQWCVVDRIPSLQTVKQVPQSPAIIRRTTPPAPWRPPPRPRPRRLPRPPHHCQSPS